MAAELRLNVALDLQYFKAQLPKLSRAAAGFQLPIKVRFDGRQVQKELNRITGRREFRINLNDASIKSAIDNVKTLKRELEGLERRSGQATAAAAPIGKTRLSKTAGQGGFHASEIQALYQQAAIDGIAGFQKGIKIKREDAVRELSALSVDMVKGLVLGLQKGRGSVEDAAKGLSDALVNSIEDRLGIRSPSFRLMKTGQYAAEGFEIGLTAGLEEAERSAVAQMQSMLRALQGEASKFGPALLMASGMGGGRGGNIRNMALMAAGMGGMFTPETEMQRERRQINERIAGRYGSSPTAAYQGGASAGRFSFSGGAQPRIAGLLGPAGSATAPIEAAKALRVLKAEARSAARAASILAEDAARAAQRQRAGLVGASGQVPLGRGGFPALPPMGGSGGSRGGGGGGGRGGGRFFRGAGDAFNNLKPGFIASIGKEFATATQQVLLFGTAYKALAAITALPGNIAKATANLQAFNNQMEAVTGGGPVMANSMKLIEETVARFNIPVQSARDGFVKLYASMQPAGIDLSTINNVFTGLSAAASTFGMSADQVDRMTYALAQMASKGQIMTEELKGQLGDVFPQAVSLFAEAAGFLDDSMDEQAKSKGLAAFLKALEDGALKGEAMSAVLSNVGGLLNSKFAPSAEKAAGSFQNQMNKLNNSLTTFYESFAPAAGAFLGEFVNPVVAALKVAGDAVKLAFSDEPLGNNELAAYLRNELFPQLENVKNALLAGIQTFGGFAQAAGAILRPIAQLVLSNQQFVNVVARAVVIGATLKAGLVALRVTGIIPLIRNIVLFNKTFRVFIAQSAAGAKGMTAMRTAAIATGQSFRQAAVGVRILATAIRTVLVSSAIGIALVAISALIEKIMQLKATADSIEAQKGSYGERVLKAAESGGSEAMTTAQRNVEAERKSRQKGIDIATKLSRGEVITAQEKAHLQGLGGYEGALGSLRERDGGFGVREKFHGNRAFGESAGPGSAFETGAVETDLKNATAALASSMHGYEEQLKNAGKNAAVVDKRFKDQTTLKDLDLSGGLDGGGDSVKASSAAILDIRKRIVEAERQLLAGKEGVNQLTIMELQKELELQQISEENISAADKAVKKQEVELKFTKDKAKLVADLAVKTFEQLEEEAEKREKIKMLLLDAQLAAGAITQAEYDRKVQLAEQAEILKRMKENGATPEQIAQMQGLQAGTPAPGSVEELAKKAQDGLNDLINPVNQLDTIATGVGETFATMFTDLATGAATAQEALGSMFSNLSDMFADMVKEIIAQWLKVQLIQGLGSIFGGMAGGGTTGGGGSSQGLTWDPVKMDFFPNANGNVLVGGFQAFANGGIVKGPTLGLVGEGRFNEAVVPLPDGRKIPVEMGKNMGGDVNSSVVVNINNSGNAQSSTKGAQGNQLAKGIEGAVKDVIMREMRPGGMIASRR